MAGHSAALHESCTHMRPCTAFFQLYRGPCSQTPVSDSRRFGGGLCRRECRRSVRQIAALAKRLKKAENFVFGTNELRPWTYKMPTLYDILMDNNWPARVGIPSTIKAQLSQE